MQLTRREGNHGDHCCDVDCDADFDGWTLDPDVFGNQMGNVEMDGNGFDNDKWMSTQALAYTNTHTHTQITITRTHMHTYYTHTYTLY